MATEKVDAVPPSARDVVRGDVLVLDAGELTWPAPPPKSLANAPPPPPPKKDSAKKDAGPKDLYGVTLGNALTTTGAAAATLAIGAVSPGAAFSSMRTKFGLAAICGYQVRFVCLRFRVR